MNQFRVIAVLLVMSLTAVVLSGQSRADKYVPDEVLIKLDTSAAANRSVERLNTEGANTVEKFTEVGWQRVKLPAGMSVEDAIARYGKFDGVAAVQPNFYYRLLATPNDADFVAGLMYGMTKISAPQAWD